jgi:hypothetical protein
MTRSDGRIPCANRLGKILIYLAKVLANALTNIESGNHIVTHFCILSAVLKKLC